MAADPIDTRQFPYVAGALDEATQPLRVVPGYPETYALSSNGFKVCAGGKSIP